MTSEITSQIISQTQQKKNLKKYFDKKNTIQNKLISMA